MVQLGPVEHEPAIRLGSQKHLLVDDHLLSDTWKAVRVQEKVRKHSANPVIVGDRPWELGETGQNRIIPRSALYDEDDRLYKMWYWGGNPEVSSGIRYACSEDGVKWVKPALGLIDFNGDKSNNICRINPAGNVLYGPLCVIEDDRGNAFASKYSAFGASTYYPDGTLTCEWLGAAVSDDGVEWHMPEQEGMRIGGGGGCPSCVWDHDLGRYVMYQRQVDERAVPGSGKRYITRQESKDLIHWSPRQTVFNPTDPVYQHVESMFVFLHEGIYFGLAVMLDTEITGNVETHLAISRDGVSWERPCPQDAFIPNGPAGEFDDRMAGWAQPVLHGDTINFYYCGSRMPHSYSRDPIVDDGTSWNHRKNPCNIGLASVPLHRLFGLRIDEPVGGFLTKPFVVEDEELYVDALVDRELRVAVVDPTVEVYDSGPKGIIDSHYLSVSERCFPRFECSDMPALVGNDSAHRVRWQGGSIGMLKGRTVRLRFMARMAYIYSFQISTPP